MSTTITKTDLIKEMARKTDLSQIKTGEFINELIAEIQSQVANGNTINITGFGSFSSKTRAAREGRNPSTGKTIHIAASVVPAFKPGANFKAEVAK